MGIAQERRDRAEDVLQEAFMNVWNGAAGYNPLSAKLLVGDNLYIDVGPGVGSERTAFESTADLYLQHYWRSGYAVLVNTPAETAFAREVALELLGPGRVTLQGPPLTGSEDFAFMLERVPGSYLFIGNGDAPGSCMVHHPGYDFNDDNIAIGSAYWVRLAERFLAAEGVPVRQ